MMMEYMTKVLNMTEGKPGLAYGYYSTECLSIMELN